MLKAGMQRGQVLCLALRAFTSDSFRVWLNLFSATHLINLLHAAKTPGRQAAGFIIVKLNSPSVS